MRKRVCFILDWYPTPKSNGCQFVKPLICAMADKGIVCDVVAPIIYNPGKIDRKDAPYHRIEKTEKGSIINIYMPTYLYAGSNRWTMRFSMNSHYRAVLRVIRKEKLHPDFVYGHFIFQAGLTAARVGKRFGIPAYCACGESSTRLAPDGLIHNIGLKYGQWKEILADMAGVISVSSYNKTLLQHADYFPASCPIEVFPNGVDKIRFHPMNRGEAREKLHFPKDAFIVSFTGAFSERKGYNRLCDALSQCDGVSSIFIGHGERNDNIKNVLFAGPVPNEEVPMYLCASDIFVLPTIGEGCCNAIIEALGCGIPVVSSNLPFNDGILNEENSIRVDVSSVDEIADAITLLKKKNELRERLSVGAVNTSEILDIKERTDKICHFIGVN